LRIGIVTTWFERGAAYVSRQYKEILEPDCEVFIYARGGEEQAKGSPIWDSDHVTWTGLLHDTRVDLKHFEEWVDINRLEVVFFNEQRWWPVVKHARSLNIKIGAYIDYYTEKTLDLFDVYDFLICNTKRHFEAFNWHPQAYYIPWGTDVCLFKPESLELVQKGILTFFHSAGMSPVSRKGTDVTIRAFNEISNLNCKLVIHTQIDLKKVLSSSDYQILKELIKRKKVVVINETVSAPGLYYLGDVYVYPTKLEGIGLSIIEALSTGMPTIVPDEAPMNEFIDFRNGLLVKVERRYSRSDGYYWPQCMIKSSELAGAMRKYVDEMEEIPKIRKYIRQRALSELNWSDRKTEVRDVFKKSQKRKINLDSFNNAEFRDSKLITLKSSYKLMYSLFKRLVFRS